MYAVSDPKFGRFFGLVCGKPLVQLARLAQFAVSHWAAVASPRAIAFKFDTIESIFLVGIPGYFFHYGRILHAGDANQGHHEQQDKGKYKNNTLLVVSGYKGFHGNNLKLGIGRDKIIRQISTPNFNVSKLPASSNGSFFSSYLAAFSAT